MRKQLLDLPASELDKLVRNARPREAAQEDEGFSSIKSPEPWHEPVDGLEVAEALRAAFKRHLVLQPGASATLTLFVMGCHAFNAFRQFPHLLINSAERESGKSTLFEILYYLVPKPIASGNMTADTIFWLIDKYQPTPLIDEADTFFPDASELASVINMSFSREMAFVHRCSGDDSEPRTFSTWCPMVIGGIGRQQPSVESRSVMITMARREQSDKVASLDNGARDALRTICRQAFRWGLGMAGTLEGYEPEMPSILFNRVRDKWLPLIAVADEIGGQWPDLARQVAVDYVIDEKSDERSAAAMLAEDIWNIFESEKKDRIATVWLVELLVGRQALG